MACSSASETASSAEPAASPAPVAPASRKPERDADIWIARTDAELDAALQETCEASRSTDRPVLLQFSAAWCTDCKRMHAMSTRSPLSEELAGWSTLIIDPGRFDRHRDLLQAFQVTRLATWVALAPEDCRLPAPAWRRLAHGSFEPVTGDPVTAEQLVAWLQTAKNAASAD